MGSPVLLNTGCWLSWPIQSGREVPEERIRKGKRDTVIQTRQATMASSLKKLVLYPLLLQLVSMFRVAPSTLEQVPRSLYFTIDLKSRGSLGPYPMTNPLHQLIEPWYHLQEEIQFSSDVSLNSLNSFSLRNKNISLIQLPDLRSGETRTAFNKLLLGPGSRR